MKREKYEATDVSKSITHVYNDLEFRFSSFLTIYKRGSPYIRDSLLKFIFRYKETSASMYKITLSIFSPIRNSKSKQTMRAFVQDVWMFVVCVCMYVHTHVYLLIDSAANTNISSAYRLRCSLL